MEINIEIVNELDNILKEKGIKKSWLAKKVGVANTSVSQWIHHKVIPELPVAYKVGEALGMSVYKIWVVKVVDKQ